MLLPLLKQRVAKKNKERSGRPPLLILNGNKARPVSYRTVQRKLYETKYHKYVVKKALEFATTMSKHGWYGVY